MHHALPSDLPGRVPTLAQAPTHDPGKGSQHCYARAECSPHARWSIWLVSSHVRPYAVGSRHDAIQMSPAPAPFDGQRFRNLRPTTRTVSSDGQSALRTFWDFFFNKPADTVPRGQVPVQPLDRASLEAAPEHSLYRLGHSTILMKLGGRWWLTDPVFAERASPLRWFGPKRFHAPPIALRDLPPIFCVLLSHDHYDHLDRGTIRYLARRAEHFVCPLGVGRRLRRWGVPASRIHEHDWWQHLDLEGVRLIATPMQHFSGRGLFDGNRTLWCSWVIEHAGKRLFFSGDGGYFDGFKAIGARHGPFDLVLMENGAYNPNWPQVHMTPEESLQAHLDLRGRCLLPIHNATFDLAMHAWVDPLERISALAARHDVALVTPRIGEPVSIDAPACGDPWWRSVDAPVLVGTHAPANAPGMR